MSDNFEANATLAYVIHSSLFVKNEDDTTIEKEASWHDFFRLMYSVIPPVNTEYRQATADNGRPYYYHIQDKTVTWEKPQGFLSISDLAKMMNLFFKIEFRPEPGYDDNGVPLFRPPPPEIEDEVDEDGIPLKQPSAPEDMVIENKVIKDITDPNGSPMMLNRNRSSSTLLKSQNTPNDNLTRERNSSAPSLNLPNIEKEVANPEVPEIEGTREILDMVKDMEEDINLVMSFDEIDDLVANPFDLDDLTVDNVPVANPAPRSLPSTTPLNVSNKTPTNSPPPTRNAAVTTIPATNSPPPTRTNLTQSTSPTTRALPVTSTPEITTLSPQIEVLEANPQPSFTAFKIHLPFDQIQTYMYDGDKILIDLLEKMCRTRAADLTIDSYVVTDINGDKINVNLTLDQLGMNEINFKRKRPPNPETSLKNFVDYVTKYTNTIEGLLANYCRPLMEESSSKKSKVITEEEVNLIFNSFTPIAETLRGFITQLTHIISITIGIPNITEVLDQFMTTIPLFQNLIASFPHSQRVLGNLYMKKNFTKFIMNIQDRMGGTLTFKDLILIPLKNIENLYHSLEDLKYSVATTEIFYPKLKEVDLMFQPIEEETIQLISPIIRENVIEELIEVSTKLSKKMITSLQTMQGKFFDDATFELSFSDDSLPLDHYEVFLFSSVVIIFSKTVGDKKKRKKFEMAVPLEAGLVEIIFKSNAELDISVLGQRDIAFKDRSLNAVRWYDMLKMATYDDINMMDFKQHSLTSSKK